MRLIEWFLFALPYIATGGAVFTEWGRNHKALVVLSGLVALITTGYFIRDRYFEYRTSEPHEITADVATLKFFDPNTSKPRVWYLTSQAGGYTLYDAPGFDPRTGIPLLPITPEIAQDLLSKAATAKAEERRHAEEAQKARQLEMIEKLPTPVNACRMCKIARALRNRRNKKPHRTRLTARMQSSNKGFSYSGSSRSSNRHSRDSGSNSKMNGVAHTTAAISERVGRASIANAPVHQNAFISAATVAVGAFPTSGLKDVAVANDPG